MPLTKTRSPGLSSQPASSEPTITVSAPATSALAMSPEYCRPPSPMTGTPAGRHASGGVEDRGDLRDADPRDHARRADRARPDADLDARPRRRRRAPARRRGWRRCPPSTCTWRVAGSALSRRDHVEHQPGVAVGDVDDEHVDARLDERGRPLPGVAEVADRGTDQQPAVGVLGGVGELLGPHEVLDGDEPGQAPLLVDERQPLALVLAQDRGGVLAADARPGAVISGIGVITSATGAWPTRPPGRSAGRGW